MVLRPMVYKEVVSPVLQNVCDVFCIFCRSSCYNNTAYEVPRRDREQTV